MTDLLVNGSSPGAPGARDLTAGVLFRLQPDRLYQLRVLYELSADERRELLGRSRLRLESLLGERFLHLRGANHLAETRVEAAGASIPTGSFARSAGFTVSAAVGASSV